MNANNIDIDLTIAHGYNDIYRVNTPELPQACSVSRLMLSSDFLVYCSLIFVSSGYH